MTVNDPMRPPPVTASRPPAVGTAGIRPRLEHVVDRCAWSLELLRVGVELPESPHRLARLQAARCCPLPARDRCPAEVAFVAGIARAQVVEEDVEAERLPGHAAGDLLLSASLEDGSPKATEASSTRPLSSTLKRPIRDDETSWDGSTSGRRRLLCGRSRNRVLDRDERRGGERSAQRCAHDGTGKEGRHPPMGAKASEATVRFAVCPGVAANSRHFPSRRRTDPDSSLQVAKRAERCNKCRPLRLERRS